MRQQSQKLALFAIERSPEINEWLSQFSKGDRLTAKQLLAHLEFVSVDRYRTWLLDELSSLPTDEQYGLFAVRKLLSNQSILWDDAGEIVGRPGIAQGSEDLVYSVVANAVRASGGRFFDHPSIITIRQEKIHKFILIDDSIGSGQRVSEYVAAMMAHPSMKSWSSYGYVTIHTLAFARFREADQRIRKTIPGSDHYPRKHPSSNKLLLRSEIVYSAEEMTGRWGAQYQAIVDLCDSLEAIPFFFRRGYGGVMGNMIFYHSVPDNTPGMLHYSSDEWKPLFPERSLPGWLITLLDNKNYKPSVQVAKKGTVDRFSTPLPSDVLRLLSLVKRGIRRWSSLAVRMDYDTASVSLIVDMVKRSGLLTESMHLTEVGMKELAAHRREISRSAGKRCTEERALYIPKTWCAGQVNIQPPAMQEEQAHLADRDSSAGGEVGQTSLERSDAKAALPPVSGSPLFPSTSQQGPATDGPLDSKDR